jgi:ABC-2 type transport system ATP-binding protein
VSVLTLDRVGKRFGDLAAVRDLSFSVAPGAVFGFLGGNGAGKTTSLRMMLDIIRPSEGRIEVLGGPPGRERAHLIGFLPEERGLYRRMRVLETIVYFGRLKRMSEPAARRSGLALLAQLELADRANTPVGALSKGLAQKVQLATALVNDPELLLLDEPFAGLDPVNQGVLERLILERARAGTTVVFSTHVMQHAERLCDRLLFLSRGRKVFEGGQDDARRLLPARLSLTARADPSGLPGVVAAQPAGEGPGGGWRAWAVELARGADPGDLLETCAARGFPLRAFDVHRPSLHEVFLRLAGDDEEAG